MVHKIGGKEFSWFGDKSALCKCFVSLIWSVILENIAIYKGEVF